MELLHISPDELEILVQERLESFYDRRTKILKELTLNKLISKNPYLLRAIGVNTTTQLIEELMKSRLTKSDETIFGEEFFEEIAKRAGGGEQAKEIGMDVVIETEDSYTVIELKSGSNWQNARMGRGLKADFDRAYEQFLAKGLHKRFVGMLGHSTGRKNCAANVESGKIYVIRSGQTFWEEITGDPDFYLKLIRFMRDYPLRLRPDYMEAWANTANKMVKQFSSLYVTSIGEIDWERLAGANSGTSSYSEIDPQEIEEQLEIEMVSEEE